MDRHFNTGSEYANPSGHNTGGAFEGGEHFLPPAHGWTWALIGALCVVGLAVMGLT
jgi:hypothetical protein